MTSKIDIHKGQIAPYYDYDSMRVAELREHCKAYFAANHQLVNKLKELKFRLAAIERHRELFQKIT